MGNSKIQVQLNSPKLALHQSAMQASAIAQQVKNALEQLKSRGIGLLPADPSDEELGSLRLDKIQLDERLLSLPKRRSAHRDIVEAIAASLYPEDTHLLAAVIRYEQDRVQICRAIRLSRRCELMLKVKERQQHDWRLHILQQGMWNPERQPISLKGPSSLPMPVETSTAESLKPFFTHLKSDGTHRMDTLDASLPAHEIFEPSYDIPALEFPRGVIYEDKRLDLCKMVVGPTHIGPLMESLRTNTFIRHFLLGNNIIGPKGAHEIATFVNDFPSSIDTWYLAGNAIHGPAFSELVDALVKSQAVTNIWLKRNPLGSSDGGQVQDLFRLITLTPNLRTLDLDQTELGDAGVAALFDMLLAHEAPTKLEILYLNGNGIHVCGASAIGRYLASPFCNITSLYMSNNPIGNEGARALVEGFSQNQKLMRLSMQSTGLGDDGASALMDALGGHPTLSVLDVGTSYSTEDLGQAYNVFTADSVPQFSRFIQSSSVLEYLNLGAVVMDTAAINTLLAAATASTSLLHYEALQIPRQPHRDSDLETMRLKQELKTRLTLNVQAKHGKDMTYDLWTRNEKRWVISDKTDVRKIDSVYRNRDAGLARRGLKTLDKWWTEENGGVLREAMDIGDAVGPMCAVKSKPIGIWAHNREPMMS